MTTPTIPLIIIQGPTATGKSDLALRLVEELPLEIISADSRQVYRLLDIGTSKPSRSIRESIPHHLIDMVYPDQEYNAGDFCHDAASAIEQVIKNGNIPLVVGGTGFYIRSLLEGLAWIPDIPAAVKEELRREINRLGSKGLYRKLRSVDPAAASRINQNDLQKLSRALEVYLYTGKPISHFWEIQQYESKYRTFNIMITENRDVLYKRINSRILKMLQDGLLTEIDSLLAAGYKETDPGMITVGYREFYPYFKQVKTLEDCTAEAQKNTRNYAKRQFTWYKKIYFDLTLVASGISFSHIKKKISAFMAPEQ